MNLVKLLSIARLLVLSLRDGLCRWHPLLETGGEGGMIAGDFFEDTQTSAGHAVESYSFSGRECREELEHLLPGVGQVTPCHVALVQQANGTSRVRCRGGDR